MLPDGMTRMRCLAFPAAARVTLTQPLERLQCLHQNICSGFRGIILINSVRRVNTKAKNLCLDVSHSGCVLYAEDTAPEGSAWGIVRSSNFMEKHLLLLLLVC